MITLSYKDNTTALNDLKGRIINSIDNAISMFAVVADSDQYFQLRGIGLDRDEGTQEFDLEILESGLADYTDPELMAPIDDAIEDNGKIAVIPLDYFNIDKKEVSKISRLLAMVDDLSQENSHYEQLSPSDISEVLGIIFCYRVGADTVYAYQKTQNMWAVKHSKLFIVNEKIKLYTKESLRIGNKFDFIIYNEVLYVKKFNVLISQFAFMRTLRMHATTLVAQLNNIVSDTNKFLVNKVEGEDKRTIRKLIKVQNSPVLNMSPISLKTRIESMPEYQNTFKYDEHGRIEIVHKKDINNLLRVLNDQVLQSPLTDARYESVNKIQLAHKTTSNK